jgi:hypothetical protein
VPEGFAKSLVFVGDTSMKGVILKLSFWGAVFRILSCSLLVRVRGCVGLGVGGRMGSTIPVSTTPRLKSSASR